MKTHILILGFGLCLGGCAHWYSQDQKTLAVEVVNKPQLLPSNCLRLQNIKGTSYWNQELAMVALRKEASQISASHVVLNESDFGFWRQMYSGEAYRCP